MSHLCSGPVCPAARHSAWWNWNCSTNDAKYLPQNSECIHYTSITHPSPFRQSSITIPLQIYHSFITEKQAETTVCHQVRRYVIHFVSGNSTKPVNVSITKHQSGNIWTEHLYETSEWCLLPPQQVLNQLFLTLLVVPLQTSELKGCGKCIGIPLSVNMWSPTSSSDLHHPVAGHDNLHGQEWEALKISVAYVVNLENLL